MRFQEALPCLFCVSSLSTCHDSGCSGLVTHGWVLVHCTHWLDRPPDSSLPHKTISKIILHVGNTRHLFEICNKKMDANLYAFHFAYLYGKWEFAKVFSCLHDPSKKCHEANFHILTSYFLPHVALSLQQQQHNSDLYTSVSCGFNYFCREQRSLHVCVEVSFAT